MCEVKTACPYLSHPTAVEGADKILDYLAVVRVLVRRPHSSSSAVSEVEQAHQGAAD